MSFEHVRALEKRLQEVEERAHRLEIAHRQLKETIDDLDGRQQKHSERLAATLGQLGGRPAGKKSPPQPPSGVLPSATPLFTS